MIKKEELTDFFNTALNPKTFKDFCPNGLQIESDKENIEKISFAVTATQESIDNSKNSDVLVVHHGLFWNYQGPLTITGNHGKRVKTLIKNETSLFAYHLPLDAHRFIGNAAVLAKLIGIEEVSPFGDYKGCFTGVSGSFGKSKMTVGTLKDKLSKVLNHDVIISTDNLDKQINSVGIITGAAQNDWRMALDADLDCFITGEINHHSWTDSRESDLTLFSCGHEATEELGIKALMSATKEKFFDLIEVEFLPSKNPV